MRDDRTIKNKTWIFYLVQILIFGPMLGLMIFAVFVTRDQSIPMLILASAGISLGVASQLIILRKIYNPTHRDIILCGAVALGLVSLPLCFVYMGAQSLLRVGFIVSLFVAYAVFLRLRSGGNA